MSCSLGKRESEKGLELTCSGDTKTSDEIGSENIRIIRIRSVTHKKIKFVCKKHLEGLLYCYASHQNKCCDAFEVHSSKTDDKVQCKKRKLSKPRSLEEITLDMRDKGKQLGLSLVPGCKFCVSCKVRFYKLLKELPSDEQHQDQHSQQQSSQSVSTGLSENTDVASDPNSVGSAATLHEDSSFQLTPTPSSLDSLNAWLIINGETPVKLKKLRNQKQYPHDQLYKVKRILEKIANRSFSDSVSAEVCEEYKNKAQYYTEMVSQLKDYFSTAENKGDKVRALTVLPKSWTLDQIKNEFGASDRMSRKAKELAKSKGILSGPEPKLGKKISDFVLERVKAFYYRNDISRELPGSNQKVSVRENGERTHKQKRLVLGNISHIHEEFCKDNPNIKISLSKFASLRPKECVLAGSSGTHIICVCSIHQNPELMFQGGNLKSLTNIDSVSDCLKLLVCKEPSESCYLRTCKNCPDGNSLREIIEVGFDEEMIETVTYNQWETTDRSNLETLSKSVLEFTDDFMSKLQQLVTHSFLAKKQYSFYNDLLDKNLKYGEVVVNADFSENFTFVVQESIQSFYFSNKQATVHPFCCYYKPSPEAEKVEKLPFVIISDHMEHGTAAVYSFQKKLIKFLKTLLPFQVSKVYYFSDGSSAQYKNRKNIANVWFHEKDFGFGCEWHFFATSHGKTACDGLGGTVKRLATLYSLKHTETGSQITTPKQLYEWAKSNILGIHFAWVSSQEVKEDELNLSVRYQTAFPIDGIKSAHAVTPLKEENAVLIKTYSAAGNGEKRKISTQELSLSFSEIRGFVTFWNQKSTFWELGYVENRIKESESVVINILNPTGKKQQYQFSSQKIQCQIECVLTVVEPTISSRGQTVKLQVADISAANTKLKDRQLRLTSRQPV